MKALIRCFEGSGLAVFVLLTWILSPGSVAGQPPVPPQATVDCGALVNGQCYVNQDFTLSTSSPGAHHFRVCRSGDLPGTNWGGCGTTMTFNTGSSFEVTGTDRPSNGMRRAYYYSACDAANQCTPWGSNPETYVKMDTEAPSASGPSTTDCNAQTAGATGCWVSGDFTLQVTPATDSGSGVDTDAYRICRSPDSTGGPEGCAVTLTWQGTTTHQVTGSHLPADGKRRAFFVRSRDHLGHWGPWNTPVYIRVDRYNPQVTATPPPAQAQPSISVQITATDVSGGQLTNSGVETVRYRWNTAPNAACTNGTAVTNGGSISAPPGSNTLYLCARDFTGRVGTWSGGPYEVSTSGGDYGFQMSGEAPYIFGCGNFCAFCDYGLGYAYDPSVIERNGDVEVFVQGAASLCSVAAHDAIVEGRWTPLKGGSVITQRIGDVSAHEGSACPDREVSPAASPDVLLNSSRGNPQEDRVVFYSLGNADAFRGKVALAYEENGGWILEDDFLLYPLCFEPIAGNSDPCTKFGIARVAAIPMGAYYYLYLEIFLSSNDVNLPVGVNPFGLKVGTLLMRLEKKATEPYVRLEQGGAQLFNPTNQTWSDLSFHNGTPRGFTLELCDGDINIANFTQWRVGGAESLGDVTMTHAGDYLMTYRPVGSAEDPRLVRYRLSSEPTFQSDLREGIIDLTSLTTIDSASIPSLHRRPNGQYVLFYSNLPGAGTPSGAIFSNATVKSVFLDVIYE